MNYIRLNDTIRIRVEVAENNEDNYKKVQYVMQKYIHGSWLSLNTYVLAGYYKEINSMDIVFDFIKKEPTRILFMLDDLFNIVGQEIYFNER